MPKKEETPEEQEKQEYRDKLPYASELIKRISKILDAADGKYELAIQQIYNLHSILPPEISATIKPEIEKLRSDIIRLRNKLPQPVVQIPIDNVKRPISIDLYKTQKEIQKENKRIYWSDFPEFINKQIILYYRNGQVIYTEELLRLIQYEYCRQEVTIVIRELMKNNLLLMTGKKIEQGGLSLVDLGETDNENLG